MQEVLVILISRSRPLRLSARRSPAISAILPREAQSTLPQTSTCLVHPLMSVHVRHRLRMRLHVAHTPEQRAKPADVFRNCAHRDTVLAVVARKRGLPAQRFANPVTDYVEQFWMGAKMGGEA